MDNEAGTTILAEDRPPRANRSVSTTEFALRALIASACGVSVAWLLPNGMAIDRQILIAAIAIPFAALFGLLAVVRFEWFVLAVLAIRPSLDIFSSGGFGPGAMLASVFTVMAALWLVVQYRSGDWVRLSIAARAMLAFVGAVLIAVTTSSLFGTSSKGALEITSGVLMFLVLEQLLHDRPDRMRRLVIVVLASGIIPVLVGTSQWLGGDLVTERTDIGRVQATFAHPNPFGTFLTILLLLTLSLVTQRVGRQRIFLLLYFVALGFMLMVTYNRASWVACTVGLLYVGLRRNRWIVVGLLAGLATVAIAVPSVADRISEITEEDTTLPSDVPDDSLEWRFQYWSRLLPMATESPITGIGPQVVISTRPEQVEPHNIFVQTYVEVGLLGTVTLVGLIAAMGRTLAARRRAATVDLDHALAVAAIAAAIALLIQAPSENLLNQTMSWWYLAAASTWGFRRATEVSPHRVDLSLAARTSAPS